MERRAETPGSDKSGGTATKVGAPPSATTLAPGTVASGQTLFTDADTGLGMNSRMKAFLILSVMK